MKYAETPLDLSPPIVVLADCPSKYLHRNKYNGKIGAIVVPLLYRYFIISKRVNVYHFVRARFLIFVRRDTIYRPSVDVPISGLFYSI